MGSVEVELDNGNRKGRFLLNELDKGILVPKFTWMKTRRFFKDVILNVYASGIYENCKYVNNYESFLKMVNEYEKNSNCRSK